MAQRVALITALSYVADLHRRTLERLFGDEVELTCHSYEAGPIAGPIAADLVVITIYQIYLNVRHLLPPSARTVIINTTLTETQFQQVAGLPSGHPVLLVNYSVEMTMETISLFHQLGLDHLEFVPCYPGIASVPRLDVAVTAGERQHVPAFVKQVVDIGGRVMDAGTIIDIATGLGLERLLQERRFLDYFSTLRTNPDRVTVLFNRTNILEEQISSLLDYLDDGLLMVGHTGLVHAGNRRAREILGTDMNVVGVRAADLFPGVPFARALKAGAGMGPTLVKLQGRDVSLKVVPIFKAGERLGALAIVNSFDAQEKVQQRLRSQLLGKGHRGRYSFEDILTQDPGLQEVKLAARRKAASDASVLISGETGTGKELFAHAIHNASPRKGWQFVTVNCAALPESLLESELFGYEEGAFTGARKGGKPGLFELAHKGTIFLDEIGEMDLGVQARLLRVLESREVMRIGGDRMIAVDIRIIAATNQDLWQRVEAGRFRKDLYYRLNVLPVQIPPLRARPGDIPFLLERLAQDGRARFEFTDEAHELLVHHAWPGNVRELKNLVDHLAILGSPVVEARDLAAILGRPPAPSAPLPPSPPPPAPTDPEEASRRFLLECLYACHQKKVRTGRRSLHQQALAHDLYLSEAQIRKLLLQMEWMGHVQLGSGRGGTTITRAGIEALQRMDRP